MKSCFSCVHVLWVSRYNYQQNWSLSTHEHEDYYQIVHILEGDALLRVKDEQIRSEGPLIMFFPPGTSHGIPFIYSNKLTTLDIKFSLHDPGLIEACKHIPFLTKPQDGEIAALLKNVVKDGLLRKFAYQQMCALQLGMVLLLLLRWNTDLFNELGGDTLFSTQSYDPDDPRVGEMVRYLDAHALQRIDSSTLERIFSQSYRHLSLLFKSEIGCTPLAYANKVRIEAAKDLLCNTDHPIKEICENLGYVDIHQFSKSFKRAVGLPPARWREKEREMICKDICIDPEFDNQNFLQEV